MLYQVVFQPAIITRIVPHAPRRWNAHGALARTSPCDHNASNIEMLASVQTSCTQIAK